MKFYVDENMVIVGDCNRAAVSKCFRLCDAFRDGEDIPVCEYIRAVDTIRKSCPNYYFEVCEDARVEESIESGYIDLAKVEEDCRRLQSSEPYLMQDNMKLSVKLVSKNEMVQDFLSWCNIEYVSASEEMLYVVQSRDDELRGLSWGHRQLEYVKLYERFSC